MNGHWNASFDVGSHPAGWTPAGIGDFNGDGTDDIAWYNPTTGNVDIWQIVNGQWTGTLRHIRSDGHRRRFNATAHDIAWYNRRPHIWQIVMRTGPKRDVGAHPLLSAGLATSDWRRHSHFFHLNQ